MRFGLLSSGGLKQSRFRPAISGISMAPFEPLKLERSRMFCKILRS